MTDHRPARPSVASLLVGVETLRANPLRTLLSTLGVVIGVAALVAILALGDGLEQFSREQIERTTDLHTITVTPRAVDRIDGVLVRRQEIPVLAPRDVAALAEAVGSLASVTLALTGSAWVHLAGDTVRRPSLVTAVLPNASGAPDADSLVGRVITGDDLRATDAVAVVNGALAHALGLDAADALGHELRVDGTAYRIVGIADPGEHEGPPRIHVALNDRARTALAGDDRVPQAVVRAGRIEDVDSVRGRIDAVLAARFGAVDEQFVVSGAQRRVAQASQAMLVFKLAIGSIAGISLIVGGIGIMNVLLASVGERTREIGVRKAAGARSRDILLQFLAESVTISGLGSIIGTGIGMVGAVGIAWAIRGLSGAPLRAGFAWSSVLVAIGAALLVGLVFGTYPARRAARLPPIEAIRHD